MKWPRLSRRALITRHPTPIRDHVRDSTVSVPTGPMIADKLWTKCEYGTGSRLQRDSYG